MNNLFRCEFGRHGATMDVDTFNFFVDGLKQYGVSNVVVSHWNDTYGYGFNYDIDDSSYSSSFIQMQPTWSEAAIVCLQTLHQHARHLQAIRLKRA